MHPVGELTREGYGEILLPLLPAVRIQRQQHGRACDDRKPASQSNDFAAGGDRHIAKSERGVCGDVQNRGSVHRIGDGHRNHRDARSKIRLRRALNEVRVSSPNPNGDRQSRLALLCSVWYSGSQVWKTCCRLNRNRHIGPTAELRVVPRQAQHVGAWNTETAFVVAGWT